MDILRGGWAPGLLGNGAGLRADSPSTGGYSTEAEAIFAAFTTPPTTGRKDLIDAAVVALKAAGVWTKLDALYAFAAADSQAAKINWIAPGTYNATEVNAPAFAADQGFTGASTKYIDAVFNPTTAPSPKFVQDSASFFAWSLTAAAVAGGIFSMGAGSGAGMNTMYPYHTDTRFYGRVNYSGDDSILPSPASTGVGFWVASRSASTTVNYYRNGTASFLSTAGASSAPQNVSAKFLTRDAQYWTGQIAAGGFGSQLSAADNTALYNALAAYMAGLATDRIAAAFTTPPSAARKTLIQNCVTSLMQGGVWDKLDALYAFAAADSQAALINWKAPGTYNATLVNAPAFTVDQGFTGASTKRVDTSFNPTTATTPNYALDSACVFGWCLTNQAVNAPLIGTFSGLIRFYPRYGDGNSYAHINIATGGSQISAIAPGTSSIGLWSLTRSSSTATEAFKNATSYDTDAGVSSARPNEAIYFGQYGAAEFFTGQTAAGGIASHLNSTEQTALYNALRTYLTGVGVP